MTDELISLVDLLPTLASATGAQLPDGAGEDGLDVLAVLTGQRPSPRSWLVHHSLNATFGLRSNNWKLVMGQGSGGFSEPVGEPCSSRAGRGQLYDLSADPGEEEDLWACRSDLVSSFYEELKLVARGPSSGLSFDVPVGEV